jgi:hypothetical protein
MGIPVHGILANANNEGKSPGAVLKFKDTKEEVYKEIARYLQVKVSGSGF